MTQIIHLNAENPQKRIISSLCDEVTKGRVIVLPTETSYVITCAVGDAQALNRIKKIRDFDNKHHFTLLCPNLNIVGSIARMENYAFKLLKHHTPGPYTFILRVSRDIPKRLMHPKKKTIGVRIDKYPIIQDLLENYKQPLLSTTLKIPVDNSNIYEFWQLEDFLIGKVDFIINTGFMGFSETTIVDLSGDKPEILRIGLGDDSPFRV